MSDFTVRCNDTARQKELQERSCEVFLIYFDSGSSFSWEEIEFASSHSANHGQYLTRESLVFSFSLFFGGEGPTRPSLFKY